MGPNRVYNPSFRGAMRAHVSPRVVIVGVDEGAVSDIVAPKMLGFECDRDQLSILGVLE